MGQSRAGGAADRLEEQGSLPSRQWGLGHLRPPAWLLPTDTPILRARQPGSLPYPAVKTHICRETPFWDEI